jgi:hypothetical protein
MNTHAVNGVDERVAAAVEHGQPMAEEEDDVDIAVPRMRDDIEVHYYSMNPIFHRIDSSSPLKIIPSVEFRAKRTDYKFL